VIEVVDDRDRKRGIDILTGDGRTHDPGIPKLGLFVVPIGNAGEIEQVGQVVPGPEKPGSTSLVVDVSTTRPGDGRPGRSRTRRGTKTLQDRPKLYSAKPKTVAWLVGLTRPKPAPKTRSTFERHIYSVEAAVTDVLQEADKDLHVVLEDGPAHMVAESPNAPFCSVDATA